MIPDTFFTNEYDLDINTCVNINQEYNFINQLKNKRFG